MRLSGLILVLVLSAAPLAAQDGTVSPPPGGQSPETATSQPSTTAGSGSANGADLPVSLSHIRQGLERQATDSILLRADLPADFKVHVMEQQKIDDMLSKLDFKSTSPAPAGGLYGYEQQQRLFNPVDHPLAQPYAAFSGGELITIAIENLIGKYLAGPALKGLSNAQREHAENSAREEVTREIEDYCAQRPDRADIWMCTHPVVP